MILLFSKAGGSSQSVAAGVASAAVAAVAPSVTLGTASVTTPAAVVACSAPAPTVSLGGISRTTGTGVASCVAVPPTITLGGVSVASSTPVVACSAPAPGVALGAAAPQPVVAVVGIAPTVTLGGVSESGGTGVVAVVGIAPTVTLGAVTPSAGTASVAVSDPSPSITLGAVSQSTPAASAGASASAPSVTLGAVTPAAGVAATAASAPTPGVQLGAAEPQSVAVPRAYVGSAATAPTPSAYPRTLKLYAAPDGVVGRDELVSFTGDGFSRPLLSGLPSDTAVIAVRAIAPEAAVAGLHGRDWDVLAAARDLLIVTNQFDSIYLTHWDDRSVSSSDGYYAVLQLLDWDEVDDAGDGEAVEQLRRVRFTLTVVGRGNDPEVRDRRIDRLKAACHNAIDGKPLASLAIPQWTKLRRWKWEKPVPPERRATVTGEFAYWVSHWDAHDTAA